MKVFKIREIASPLDLRSKWKLNYKMATGKYVYDNFGVGSTSSKCLTRGQIDRLGLMVKGIHQETQLVDESEISQAMGTVTVTYTTDGSAMYYYVDYQLKDQDTLHTIATGWVGNLHPTYSGDCFSNRHSIAQGTKVFVQVLESGYRSSMTGSWSAAMATADSPFFTLAQSKKVTINISAGGGIK